MLVVPISDLIDCAKALDLNTQTQQKLINKESLESQS